MATSKSDTLYGNTPPVKKKKSGALAYIRKKLYSLFVFVTSYCVSFYF